MRLIRIQLRNFRGVDHSTVDFADSVTVVEGPNEAGKSSLAEAISLLRTAKATSNAKEVRAVRPLDRDADPEVELELTTGPYHLTFRKVWSKKGLTELTVAAPSPQQLTGEAAHERFTQILTETVDMDLLEALAVVQGESLQQPALARVTALHQALSQGTHAPDAGQDVLLDRIEQEYAVYFTGTGRPTGAYAKAGEQLTRAQDEVSRLQRDSEALDSLVQLRQRTAGALDEARERYEKAVAAQATLAADARELQHLADQEAATARDVQDSARALAQATDALAQRDELARAVQEAEKDARTTHEDAQRQSRALEEAHRALSDATTVYAEATATRMQQEEELERATSALEEARTQRERALLRGRVERANAASAVLADVQQQLEHVTVTDDDAAQLENLEVELRLAQRAQQAAAARVTVHTLGTHPVEVNGRVVAGADAQEIPVLADIHVAVPGVMELTVQPGTPPQELAQAETTAREALREALARARATSAAHARTLAAARAQLLAREKSARGDVEYVLAGEELATLNARLRELDGRLPAQPADAVGNVTELEEVVAALQRSAKDARAASDAALEALEAARLAATESDKGATAARVHAEHSRAAASAKREQLESARLSVADSQLVERENAARAAWEKLTNAHDAVREQLRSHDPETLAIQVDNANALVASLDEQVQELRQQLAGQEGVLRHQAGLGIYDKLSEAQAALETAQRAYDRLGRAARAVSLLRTTMRRRRDEAQLQYVAPFKARIERLGRLVFGPDFAVEISPQLAIVSRTLAGTTVPFEYLSAGAREQLALLGRLACAQTVDPQDGAPVIIDDALGFSDPQRLRALAAVLHDVGRTAQVVVLTCQPDRFAALGGATVVRL